MLTPPTTSCLPQVVEPRRLVNQGVTLRGNVDRELCARFAGAVIEISAPIEAELVFELADQGRKVVHITASTSVLIHCQRCLERMTFPLEIDTVLGIVWSEEEAKSLPKDLDPWVVEEEAGDIAALVEDEFLLALPFAACHPEDQCSVILSSEPLEDESLNEDTENPFSILEQLKKQ